MGKVVPCPRSTSLQFRTHLCTSSQKPAKSRTRSLSFPCSFSNPFSYSLFILGDPLLSAYLANVF